jgi:carbamoyl-phosphate synthase large subunit
MKSTGESIGTGSSFGEAYSKAETAAGTALPVSGRVFVSVHEDDRETILPVVRDLEALGFHIAATRGTSDFLYEHGVFSEVILKIHEGHPNIIDHMRSGRIDLLINTPLGKYSQEEDSYMRVEAVKRKIPYTTTSSAAEAAVEGIRYLLRGELSVMPLKQMRG